MEEKPEQFPVANVVKSSGGDGGLEHPLSFTVRGSL